MLVRRFSAFTTLACFFLLIAGGLVHATNSGMACGTDWPLCSGLYFPKMEGGVFYEHGHRLTAMAVGILTLVQGIWLLRRRKSDRVICTLALLAIPYVGLLAYLGKRIVNFNLPAPIKMAHFGLAAGFFALLLTITLRLFRPERTARPALPGGLRQLLLGTAIATYLQVVIGAFVRHTGGGLACMDIPFCQSALWPEGGPAQLQMVHRYVALLIAIFSILVSVRSFRALRGPVRALALAPAALVVVQIALGIFSVLSFLQVAIVTAHLATGVALLASLLILFQVTSRRTATRAARSEAWGDRAAKASA